MLFEMIMENLQHLPQEKDYGDLQTTERHGLFGILKFTRNGQPKELWYRMVRDNGMVELLDYHTDHKLYDYLVTIEDGKRFAGVITKWYSN